MENCILPAEMCEYILRFADGDTLLNAELVCTEWEKIVSHLGKHTSVWKNACIKNIPYSCQKYMYDKCNCEEEKMKWEILFRNWKNWQNIENCSYNIINNKDYKIATGLNDISCAKISGSMIVYGSKSGYLISQNETYEIIDHLSPDWRVPIKDIHFLKDDRVPIDINSGYDHTHLLVVCSNHLKLINLYPQFTELGIYSVTSNIISVDKNRICLSHDYNRLVLITINITGETTDIIFNVTDVIVMRHIFQIISLSLFEENVFIVADNTLYKWKFVESRNLILGSDLPYDQRSNERVWFFRNELFIALGNPYMYVTIINKDNVNNVITRKFNWMRCFNSFISDINYYANVLLVSLHSEWINLYVIKNWSTVDFLQPNLRLNFPERLVTFSDFQEMRNESRLILINYDFIAQIFFYNREQSTIAVEEVEEEQNDLKKT